MSMSNEKWLKAAMIWINNMANPNEGMTHPLDDDKLKSIANAMASLNVVVDEDVIYEEGRALRICDESIEMIIEAFRKAGQRIRNGGTDQWHNPSVVRQIALLFRN